MKSKIYEWHSRLRFGRYEGRHLDEVFQEDPKYVLKCLEKKKKFNITIDTLRHLQDLDPKFEFTEKALQSVVNAKKYNTKPGESEFKLYPSGDPYIQPLDDISWD